VRDVQIGKAKRVLGVFVILAGGGVALEGRPAWPGVVLMFLGGLLLAWGFQALRDRQRAVSDEGGQE